MLSRSPRSRRRSDSAAPVCVADALLDSVDFFRDPQNVGFVSGGDDDDAV